MILEICANSYQSAINAQKAGAHRIELCTELGVGGITPSYGLLKLVLKALSIPVYVLIRPRSGDFVYSEDEFNAMKTDITVCKDLGVAGIVSGTLNSKGELDVNRTKELIDVSKPLEFTFHRAFDELRDPFAALERLIDMGADRVLTSGQAPKAEGGLELIEALVEKARNRISIMPGGGISADNAFKFKSIGIAEIHASCSVGLTQCSGLFSMPQTVSDPEKIKALLNAL